MELAVKKWAFNPKLLKQVVKIEGVIFDGAENVEIDSVYVVHSIAGDRMEVLNVLSNGHEKLRLNLGDFAGDGGSYYWLKLTLLDQGAQIDLPSECSIELWGDEDDEA